MIRHIYHYNVHSEQRYFLGERPRSFYDLIAFNGNIVSHTPQGVAGFVATSGKPFFIDPQTHAFQHRTINLKKNIGSKKTGEGPNFEFKPSIIKLVKDYLKSPFQSVLDEDRPIKPNHFRDNDSRINTTLITEVCERIIEFQKSTLINRLDDDSREFLETDADLQPEFILPPYFFISNIETLDWFDIVTNCYTKTKEIEAELPVYFYLVISPDVIEEFHQEILDRLSLLRPDGILLWLDDVNEESLGLQDGRILIKFLRDLRRTTDSIINLHGGYFSTLLCHEEIGNIFSGVGHSVNYGESRAVVPIGGGIPMARYYMPALHSRLRFGDALGIIRAMNWLNSAEEYKTKVCGCDECTRLINEYGNVSEALFAYGDSNVVQSRRRSGSIISLEYPTREAKLSASWHYLYNKHNEYVNVQGNSLGDLLNQLDASFDELYPQTGSDLIAHLKIWKKIIEFSS